MRYIGILLPSIICVGTAILGGFVGVLSWFFAVAYSYVSVIVAGYLISAAKRANHNGLGRYEMEMLSSYFPHFSCSFSSN